MMGRLVGDRDRLFYAFDLDAVVPADHLVRRIDGVLDLSWLHSELAPFYSHTGRPSIDPELMIRMLIVGYVFAIGSERQRCAEVQVNLAYRWFCGLPIEDDIPDHSVFSGARHEGFREGDILRRVFEPVVGTCIVEGSVGGEALSVDASLIEADVNPAKRLPGDEPIAWPARDKASRAVRGYLSALDRESAEAPAADGGRASKPRMAVSLTDPQAAWVADRKIRSIFAYHANYPIDKSARNDGPFSPAEFHYDQPRNLYICPGGKALKTSGTAHDGTTYKYLAKRRDCQICPPKPKCTKGKERRLARDVDEPIRDRVRAQAGTAVFRRSRDQPKKVETAFAPIKRMFKLDRFRLRGLNRARDQILLTATAPNLRKLARSAARPPPTLNPARCHAKITNHKPKDTNPPSASAESGKTQCLLSVKADIEKPLKPSLATQSP